MAKRLGTKRSWDEAVEDEEGGDEKIVGRSVLHRDGGEKGGRERRGGAREWAKEVGRCEKTGRFIFRTDFEFHIGFAQKCDFDDFPIF